MSQFSAGKYGSFMRFLVGCRGVRRILGRGGESGGWGNPASLWGTPLLESFYTHRQPLPASAANHRLCTATARQTIFYYVYTIHCTIYVSC